MIQPTVAQRERQRQRNREWARERNRERETQRERETGKTVPQQPLVRVSEEQRCYCTKAFYMTLLSSGKGGWGGEKGQGGMGVGRDGQDQPLPIGSCAWGDYQSTLTDLFIISWCTHTGLRTKSAFGEGFALENQTMTRINTSKQHEKNKWLYHQKCKLLR